MRIMPKRRRRNTEVIEDDSRTRPRNGRQIFQKIEILRIDGNDEIAGSQIIEHGPFIGGPLRLHANGLQVWMKLPSVRDEEPQFGAVLEKEAHLLGNVVADRVMPRR